MNATNEAKAVLDKAAAVRRMGDDEELYGEVLDVFFEDVPVQLTVLRQAHDANDHPTAERQAHSLKSAAGNVGADEMREACLRAETAYREGHASSDVLGALCRSIEECFQRVLRTCGRA